MKKLLSIIILLAALAVSSKVSAQVFNPYPVTNSLPCAVRINWKAENGACVPCNSGSAVVPGSSTFNINFNAGFVCAVANCNIIITITDVGGTPITPVTVDANTTSGTFSYPSGPCGSGGLTPVSWTTGGTSW